jgi:hypothetical protein
MAAEYIGAEESLGRRVFSGKHAARARRGRVVPHVFMAKSTLISVDWLSAAPPDEIEKLAQEASKNRSGPFRGWAVITCSRGRDAGRQVVHSPRDDNPYHVDIRLPALADDNHDEQLRHAQELAAAAGWRNPAA